MAREKVGRSSTKRERSVGQSRAPLPDSKFRADIRRFPADNVVWRQLSRLSVCCQVLLLALQRASRQASTRASFRVSLVALPRVSLKALFRLALVLTPWPGQRVLRAQPSFLELQPWVLELQVSRRQVPSSGKLSVQVGDFDSSHKQEQFARQLSNRHTLRPDIPLKTHMSSSGHFEQRPCP